MKSVISPYDDIKFNHYLLSCFKKRLMNRCKIFEADNIEHKYYLNNNTDKYYTYKDVIMSIKLLHNRIITFSNQRLINHIVYDLSQRFWYTELNIINNMIPTLYLRFKQSNQ